VPSRFVLVPSRIRSIAAIFATIHLCDHSTTRGNEASHRWFTGGVSILAAVEMKMKNKLAAIALGGLLVLGMTTASFAQDTGVNDAGRGMSNDNRGMSNNNNGYNNNYNGGATRNSSGSAGVNDAGSGMSGGNR
jgi:hypothetical protein